MTDISRHHRLQAEIEELMPMFRSLAEAFCKNPTDADDLVRDTVASAVANLDQFTDDMSLEAWMFANMHGTYRRKFDISE
ncbi:sigma factor [Rhizobium sp. NXC24]|uniref:sigma factor n=1 Tax=Rhizobium sp. NXC24 TaxID=2048897 RepID=UPI00131A55DD|nr:sigma factor [Rhizobium sp. NXC24]